MSSLLNMAIIFVAKVVSNAFGTAKTILLQRGRWIIAGFSVMISDYIYFLITKSIVTEEGNLEILIVSIASGVGCTLACFIGEWLSKDRKSFRNCSFF